MRTREIIAESQAITHARLVEVKKEALQRVVNQLDLANKFIGDAIELLDSSDVSFELFNIKLKIGGIANYLKLNVKTK